MVAEDGWASGLPADATDFYDGWERLKNEPWNPPGPNEMETELTLQSVKSDDGVHCAFFYGQFAPRNPMAMSAVLTSDIGTLVRVSPPCSGSGS
jgi:hypothetical protein